MAAPQLASLGAGTLASFDSLVAQFQPWLALAGRMTDSVSVALQAAGPHLMWYLAALVGVAYATCIGLGTVGYRLVANRI